MTAVILCAMALFDAAFAGFRSWAGRDGRVRKMRSRQRSAAFGLVAGLLALAVIGVVAIVVMASTAATYNDLVAAGRRMIYVYAPFCIAVALGFVGYFSSSLEGQAMSTVVVLGPATFARPLVIVGGAVAASWGASGAVAVVAFVAAATMLAVEPMLSRWWANELRGHPHVQNETSVVS